MADTVEQQDIRGLDIDKTVKGFALEEFVFMNDCLVSSMSGDSVRWYQESSTDLTSQTPAAVANISPLSQFPTLEASWTRNTSYVKKYAAEGFISMEDMKSSDLDLTARTLLRLTRAVAKQVDTAIYNCATENDTPVNINTVASTAAWDAASGQDIIEDLMDAKYQIRLYSYNPEGASLWLSPKDYKSMVTWLISSKGASIPNFSSDKLASGTVMQILGLNVKVSNNVTADKAVVIIPQKAVTWKSYQDITSRAIEEQGIGTKFRVFQLGVGLLTDPRAVCLITNTQT